MKGITWVLMLVLLACGAAAFAADRATIAYIEGDVTMNGAPASIGDDVPPGAVLATSQDSLCQVVFNAKNIVHLAANTTLRFDNAALSRGATLQKGAVAMVLRKLAPAPGNGTRFTIKTSTGVAGVRGTCFFIAMEDENNTYICACNGSIEVDGDANQFSQDLFSSHHAEVRVTRTASGEETVSPAPLLYHTSADVEAIAAKIGEKIDWTTLEQ